MKAKLREWVDKAEGDFVTMLREYRARKSPNYDSACFHAQQCAEKYLKARLQAASIRFPRTHDLTVLLDLATEVEPAWAIVLPVLRKLTRSAVEVRYPGRWATKRMAKEAVATCKHVRDLARIALKLPRKSP
jgi:HEPN domain-containing protein